MMDQDDYYLWCGIVQRSMALPRHTERMDHISRQRLGGRAYFEAAQIMEELLAVEDAKQRALDAHKDYLEAMRAEEIMEGL